MQLSVFLNLKVVEGHKDGSELWQLPGAEVAEVAVLCEKVFSLGLF